MPCKIKLVNGDHVYAAQDATTLVRAAAENLVITATATKEGEPDVHVVVANILTIADGERRAPRVTAL